MIKNMKLLSITTAILTAVCDLKIKDVMREISPEEVIYNKGFAANALDGHPRAVAAVSAAFTAVLTAMLVSGSSSPEDELPDALILGGAVSNTAERIVRGKVTDYIPMGKYVYNIGDFAIYAGALAKIINSLRR